LLTLFNIYLNNLKDLIRRLRAIRNYTETIGSLLYIYIALQLPKFRRCIHKGWIPSGHESHLFYLSRIRYLTRNRTDARAISFVSASFNHAFVTINQQLDQRCLHGNLAPYFIHWSIWIFILKVMFYLQHNRGSANKLLVNGQICQKQYGYALHSINAETSCKSLSLLQ
jgi:hypothetical protein